MTDQELIARLQQELDRYQYTVQLQMQEIDRQGAEINRLLNWINGDSDALTCLQAFYNDPEASVPNRVKAASAAIAFERPKLSVSVNVGPGLLGQRLDQARIKTIEPKVIEHQPA